jgi:hypothetical protein
MAITVKSTIKFAACFGLFSVLLAPGSAFGWGCQGHQIVAYIAERELNPAALSAVNELLTGSPITGVHRFCTNPAGNTPMSDAATWADDVRDEKGNGDWHFIDVQLRFAGDDPMLWCKNDCVISALNEQLAVLRDPASGDTERVEALRYVIHFVGDVHQPLHAITNDKSGARGSTVGDRGGNCVPVFFDQAGARARGGRKTELHHIWDTEMVVELMQGSDAADPQGLAQMLAKEITDSERSAWNAKTEPKDWAVESSLAAAKTGYTGLTAADGSAVKPEDIADSQDLSNPTKCDADAQQRILALKIHPDGDYRSAAEAVIEERLKQAGVRLAKLLNDTWPEDAAAPHSAFHRVRGNQ